MKKNSHTVASSLIAFHRPGAGRGAEVRRRETSSTVTVERWRRDARRPRRSSLMILLVSRSNAGSVAEGRALPPSLPPFLPPFRVRDRGR